MNDEQAFLRTLADEPEDDATRQVYADWLQEHDGSPRAEYLRVELQMAGIGMRAKDDAPEHRAYVRCLHRLHELREVLDLGWVDAAGRRYSVVLKCFAGDQEMAVRKRLRELLGGDREAATRFAASVPCVVQTSLPYSQAERRARNLSGVSHLPIDLLGHRPQIGCAVLIASPGVKGPDGEPIDLGKSLPDQFASIEEMKAATAAEAIRLGMTISELLRAENRNNRVLWAVHRFMERSRRAEG